MFLKKAHKWLASIVLLATVLSFSGFTSYTSSYTKKPQTELVISNTSINQVHSKSFTFLNRTSQKITFNQYTTFCFKWLLNTHQYSYNLTFKSQKETLLQFNKQLFLEQNLIAQTVSNELHNNFIK